MFFGIMKDCDFKLLALKDIYETVSEIKMWNVILYV